MYVLYQWHDLNVNLWQFFLSKFMLILAYYRIFHLYIQFKDWTNIYVCTDVHMLPNFILD